MSFSEQLARRERELVNAVFALGNRAPVDAIRAQLKDPPSYSAVRAMLVKLEKKGHLRHEQDGARYLYSATASPAAAKRAALRQYVKAFFGGSLGQMVSALVRQESWTEAELDALEADIRHARQRPRSRKGGNRG